MHILFTLLAAHKQSQLQQLVVIFLESCMAQSLRCYMRWTLILSFNHCLAWTQAVKLLWQFQQQLIAIGDLVKVTHFWCLQQVRYIHTIKFLCFHMCASSIKVASMND